MDSQPVLRRGRARLTDDHSMRSQHEITPSKYRQPLDDILDRLNGRWNLELPRLYGNAANDSETTRALAKRCSARLRYLSYRGIDMDGLLKEFDQKAAIVHSNWKFKPEAEKAVTPSRRTNDSELSRRILKGKLPAVSDQQRQGLLLCLDNVLQDPYQEARLSDSFKIGQPGSESMPSLATMPTTRAIGTMRDTAKIMKPVARSSTPMKSEADVKVPAKRQSDAKEPANEEQKRPKTIHHFFGASDARATRISSVADGSAADLSSGVAKEAEGVVPSSNDTELLEDDAVDRFPSTQEGADTFNHLDIIGSMDSGYASSSPNPLYDRLACTFNQSRLNLPTVLDYNFVYELQSLALSLSRDARELWVDVSKRCGSDQPGLEQRHAAYKAIAGSKSHETFTRSSWTPDTGLAAEKQSHRSLYQEASLSWSQNRRNDPSPFDVRLHAPRTQKSCRFHRIFGGDRFLVLNMPDWKESALPGTPEHEFHEMVSTWICRGIRLGYRNWYPFWIEDKAKRDDDGNWFKQVHLFATTGRGLDKRAVSLKEFLSLHAPLQANMDSTNLKLFARGKLGLSKTTPTVVLYQDEFLQVDDIRSRIGTVMTDGCARMSRDLGIAVTQSLGLDEVPSVFQGRISGAKGVWIVDKRSSFRHNLHNRDFWIEITASQLKIHPHPRYRDSRDEIRTFEVCDWAKMLRPSSLNAQLINVMYNRGVRRDILAARLKSLTEDYYEELCESLDKNDPLLTHAWLQKYHSGRGQRLDFEIVGGRPVARVDQIKTYLDVGFSPREHRFLHDLVTEVLREYLIDYVEKPRIELARSTAAFMIPDVWGVLKEGEVQLCLGQAWKDPVTGLESTFIAGIDGLVARNPANHPGDVQRVRLAHYAELADYSNIIFFSTKGDRPLADYLSGGDYDGDQAFVCWDPEIVEDFSNFRYGPPDHIQPEDVGLVKCSTQLTDVFAPGINDASIRTYLTSCMKFALGQGYVGIVTNTHVAYVYSQSLKTGHGGKRNALQSDGAIMLAALAAFLVDASKQGYSLPANEWGRLRKQLCGPGQLPTPAYTEPEDSIRAGFRSENILDHLRFNVARAQKDTILSLWWKLEKSWPWKLDDTLLQPCRAFDRMLEQERKENNGRLCRQVIDRLQSDLDTILDAWKLGTARRPGRDPATTLKAMGEIYESYKKIQPLQLADHQTHPLVQALTWDKDTGSTMWQSLRASFLYKTYNSSKFVWSMAGMELCEIKAREMGHTIPVLARSYGTMKLNNRAVKAATEVIVVEDQGRDFADDEDETQWYDAQVSLDDNQPLVTTRNYY